MALLRLERVGGMLISLSKAVSPEVIISLLSVTHGQCDARPTVIFPACAGTRLILPGDKRRMYVNSLPKVTRDNPTSPTHPYVRVFLVVPVCMIN